MKKTVFRYMGADIIVDIGEDGLDQGRQEKKIHIIHTNLAKAMHTEFGFDLFPNEDVTHTCAIPANENHFKDLPENVRLKLAEYCAKQFLDGVEEGKNQHSAHLVERIEEARKEGYANGYAQCCADNNLMTHDEMIEDLSDQAIDIVKDNK